MCVAHTPTNTYTYLHAHIHILTHIYTHLHTYTYTNAHTHSLNDIAATGPDSFYFVNFNYFLRMGVPEGFLNINKGSVGHHSGTTSKLLLENLSYPNGVLVSPNRKLVLVYYAVFNITIYTYITYIYTHTYMLIVEYIIIVKMYTE